MAALNSFRLLTTLALSLCSKAASAEKRVLLDASTALAKRLPLAVREMRLERPSSAQGLHLIRPLVSRRRHRVFGLVFCLIYISEHVYIYTERYRSMGRCSIYHKIPEKQKFTHTTENSAAVRRNDWGRSAALLLNTIYTTSSQTVVRSHLFSALQMVPLLFHIAQQRGYNEAEG